MMKRVWSICLLIGLMLWCATSTASTLTPAVSGLSFHQGETGDFEWEILKKGGKEHKSESVRFEDKKNEREGSFWMTGGHYGVDDFKKKKIRFDKKGKGHHYGRGKNPPRCEVPAPSSILLLTAGLVGLASFGAILKKKA